MAPFVSCRYRIAGNSSLGRRLPRSSQIHHHSAADSRSANQAINSAIGCPDLVFRKLSMDDVRNLPPLEQPLENWPMSMILIYVERDKRISAARKNDTGRNIHAKHLKFFALSPTGSKTNS